MQSSPSPTSIIVNINQSNYLCSQTPDPPPVTQQYKDDYVFLKPTKNSRIKVDSIKQTSIKQVVIVQKGQKPRPQRHPPAEVSYLIKNMQRPAKVDNYDFKKLVINHSVTNEQGKFLNITAGKHEEFRQNNILDEYTTNKPKLYFTENGVIPTNDDEQDFTAHSYINDCGIKESQSPIHHVNNDHTTVLKMETNEDSAQKGDNPLNEN